MSQLVFPDPMPPREKTVCWDVEMGLHYTLLITCLLQGDQSLSHTTWSYCGPKLLYIISNLFAGFVTGPLTYSFSQVDEFFIRC